MLFASTLFAHQSVWWLCSFACGGTLRRIISSVAGSAGGRASSSHCHVPAQSRSAGACTLHQRLGGGGGGATGICNYTLTNEPRRHRRCVFGLPTYPLGCVKDRKFSAQECQRKTDWTRKRKLYNLCKPQPFVTEKRKRWVGGFQRQIPGKSGGWMRGWLKDLVVLLPVVMLGPNVGRAANWKNLSEAWFTNSLNS